MLTPWLYEYCRNYITTSFLFICMIKFFLNKQNQCTEAFFHHQTLMLEIMRGIILLFFRNQIILEIF